MRAFASTLLAAFALAVAGCGDDTPATAPTPVRSSPVTETFDSSLVVKGSAWRIVNALQNGTLSATLTSADQPGAVVGFGLGMRSGSGTDCLVTKDVVTTAGSSPQLSAPVDAGSYCVKISDTGTLTTPMKFTITITYP